jgi:hypothetical protein
MPQSIAYQRQNIGSKTSTEKLQGKQFEETKNDYQKAQTEEGQTIQ